MYDMTWHELLSLTPEKKKNTVCINVLQRTTVHKIGEADELQL